MSTNVCVLTGRLGKDPEVKSLPNGNTVASFSIALDRGYGDKKKTVWADVEAWGKTAEAVGRLVVKGNRVTVVAEYDVDTWQDNGGNKKFRSKFIANRVDIIDFPETVGAGASSGAGSSVSDDDIPF